MSDVESRLEQRARRTAESILENESLTSDLDDVAARALLDWGLDCAKVIVQRTVDLDDSQADEAMSLGLRAIRRLMRSANKWVSERWEMDAESQLGQLNRIVEQASIIYGVDFSVLDSARCDAFVRRLEHVDDPVQMIADLREFVESPDI